MSAHMTPVLSGAIPSFELFMARWEKLGEEHHNLRAWTEIGLKWATKYYKRMDDTDAYVISMCELLFDDSFYFSESLTKFLTHVSAFHGLKTSGRKTTSLLRKQSF
jgi:hypothetical protein